MSKIQYMLFLTALLSLLSVETMFSQTYEFNTSGNTVSFPTGTVLKVEAWGGGGRGGTRTSGSNSYGGGGGGAYASSTIVVEQTSAYWVNVGTGSNDNGNPGGDSWFSTNTSVNNALVLAKGGSSVPNNNNTTGAAGGYYDDCIGDIRNNGGRGADGDHSTSGHGGGGGGSSAGATGVGVNATNNFGAVGPSGYDGIGGNGSNDNGNGSSGSIPGGGGGGAQRTGGSSTGGNGANGRVIITVLGPQSTITQTGTTQWIAPEGVTAIEVEAWGAGGRGGQRSSGNNSRGGGGGGGAYSRGLIAVTPGQTYYINTGAGSTTTAAGGSSWFNSSNSAPTSDNYVLAAGGNSAPNNSNNGANGGSLNSGYGNQEKRSGGDGANSTGSSTGGGGASAGPGANGGNASGSTGGIAPTGGGNGANGHNTNTNTNGNPGLTPGGGGSGARRNSGTQLGGAGAHGQVIIRTLDLSVSKSVVGNNTTPLVGSNITFTITATNNSTSTVSGINVTDVLPSGFTYVSNNGGATHNSGTVTWNVGSLAPSASATLQLTVEVNASGSYANTATLNIDVDDTNVAVSSDRITLFPQQPATNLQLTKEVDNAMPLISEEVVFTLTVYNGGPQNATGVEVVDILPFGLSHVSNSGGYDSTTGIWTIGSLNNGATATLMLTAKVNPTGNHYSQAVVSGNEFDPDLTNNSSGTQVYPTYPLTEIVLACATTSYDLTGFAIGTPPPGAEISWHTASPADDTNKITTPASVRAGETYYVAFYDPIELCYGSTSEVKITRSCLISNPMIRQRVK